MTCWMGLREAAAEMRRLSESKLPFSEPPEEAPFEVWGWLAICSLTSCCNGLHGWACHAGTPGWVAPQDLHKRGNFLHAGNHCFAGSLQCCSVLDTTPAKPLASQRHYTVI